MLNAKVQELPGVGIGIPLIPNFEGLRQQLYILARGQFNSFNNALKQFSSEILRHGQVIFPF